jgi:hypothetical protein
VGVSDLQRVEGPLHEIEASGDSVVALGELEAAANARVAVLRQYGEHVRVEVWEALTVTRQRHGEAYQCVLMKGTDNLAPNALSNYEDTPRDDVAVAITPDFELKDDAPFKVFEAGKGLNLNVVLRACVHDDVGSLAAFLA